VESVVEWFESGGFVMKMRLSQVRRDELNSYEKMKHREKQYNELRDKLLGEDHLKECKYCRERSGTDE